MNKKKNNYFRRISHPKKNLILPKEAINHLKSKDKPIPAVNPEAVYMEFLNYFDPYDVGLDIGYKEIRCIAKKPKLNQIHFKWNQKPSNYQTNPFSRQSWNKYKKYKNKEIANTKFNINKVGEHITQQRKWYWTGNPFSSIRLLGTDIDNHTNNPEAVLPFLQLLRSYYPHSFYDNGSSGKSLHYYPKIDMLPLYEYYSNNTSIADSWAKFANTVVDHTGKIFEIYGTNILCPEHTLVKRTGKTGNTYYSPDYHVHFDGFKGTYPEYDFYINQNEQVVITELVKNGVFHKFPNLFTVDDLVLFRDAPVYSILHHLSVIIYLCNIILLSGCYSDKEYKDLTTALQVIEPVLVAHSVFLPCQEKNFVALTPRLPVTLEEKREEKELSIYTSTFENVRDISLENDALKRSKRYLYYCYMQYIITEGREPTKEEYRQDYRQDVGTGTEDEGDRIRLDYIYDTNIDRMRTYNYGDLSYKIDQMVRKLIITQDEIDKNHTYYRKLWKREVAITAVWIELCLTNIDYIEKKNWWSLSKGEHFSRELTVPMTSLEKFIECLKSKELNKNGCNPSKARALREFLIDMEWMQCVDDSVVVAAQNNDKGGRARRYILLPAHPSYDKFEKLVGKDRIDYWTQFREEQLKQRKNKKWKRKIG